ncbi:hypothetical protein PQQ86_32340 [Paraburkholderia sediminicola]|uniref:hypothetical protein n=1 Tax=Paraburkholderia sediminicola TaxID=458836 RepID=UPI0038BDD3DE
MMNVLLWKSAGVRGERYVLPNKAACPDAIDGDVTLRFSRAADNPAEVTDDGVTKRP